jgi:CheY-like chemotaxis protein
VPNILIVDDDVDLLDGQALFLTEHGHRVETARSMEEGLAKLTSFNPDLILADLMMEAYDSGMVFCKKVRESPATSGTPIIMQTAAIHEIGFVPAQGGAGDGGKRSDTEWLFADEILTKPVALDLLLKKIEQHLMGRNDG